ncbi:hypothetical protein TSUD_413230 [Trifolium subterraneum]|uniref:Uncharacterized protein n=1 Tax=Trifolium subterraneum TaxID=3900 RepID=A0A2Z6PKN1_TRISU|nr:hypothetical protein TSUD_413230 [Trifolium subterraneum]
MLLSVDKALKQGGLSDGSHRVRRVCMDPTIIDKFCAQGSYFTPTKCISSPVDLDSDGLSDEPDDDGDSDSIEFLKDLIVVPPPSPVKSPAKNVVRVGLKRNLNKAFEDVPKPPGTRRLRKIKLEED